MKKCPFCAEEIQDQAIKCKHCGERLDRAAHAPAPASASAASPAPSSGAASGAAILHAAASAPAPSRSIHAPSIDADKELLYTGSPSWRAYFGWYALTSLLTPCVAAFSLWAAVHWKASTLYRILGLLIPIAVGVVVFFTVTLVRRSVKVRVSERRIENESGVFSKKIDILELWRVRDLQYRQSFLDRILGISHIVVFAHDESAREESRGSKASRQDLGTIHLIGLPEGRRLFDQLRDQVSIQRQSNRVIGMTD